MSPRAACRLETLGFEQVYDYAPGKSDWLARGLPSEGKLAGQPTAGTLARTDAVTCPLDEPVGQVAGRLAQSPHPFAIVLSEQGIVLGRLPRTAIEGVHNTATAEAIMEPGPSTVRLNLSAHQLAERLDQRKLSSAIVTRPDGFLIGVVTREQLP